MLELVTRFNSIPVNHLYPKRLHSKSSQKFALFFGTLQLTKVISLYFELSSPLGCKAIHEFFAQGANFEGCSSQHALTALFRRTGQSPILASSWSPARIGPTPDGVPVKIKSPGISVSD
jgi:hypothetical protein